MAGLMGHILVDEYQDTNATQYALLWAAGGREGPLYRRGGRRPVHLRLARGHAGQPRRSCRSIFPSQKIKLEQNYRSTSAILRTANNVIGPTPKLFPKTLFSELGEGEPVRVVDADNEEHEAERARRGHIQSLRAQGALAQTRRRTGRLCHPVPRQPPGQTVREGAAQGQYPLQVSGGQSFF